MKSGLDNLDCRAGVPMLRVGESVGFRIKRRYCNSRSPLAVERESWPDRASVRSGRLWDQAARTVGG
jgi:hypothetical protein